MRILFYLPVATGILARIRSCRPSSARSRAEAEVHIVVPLFWRLTGADEQPAHAFRQSAADPLAYPERPGSPFLLGSTPAQQDALGRDFIHQIAPDYVFCRSAGVDTPSRFPGKVRYLMEAGYAPLVPDQLIYGEHIWLRMRGC